MRFFALFVLSLLVACAESSVNKPAGESCGDVVCGDGLVCCNASCGICTPPGGVCTGMICEAPVPCEVTDAAGVGDCDLFLGWAFDGLDCVPLSGCSCEGTDCDALFGSAGECELECVVSEVGDSCGGFTGAQCSSGFYCDFEEGSECMAGGTCQRSSPDDCVGVPVEVCGCDGLTHASPCAAYAAGTDVAFTGPCDPV